MTKNEILKKIKFAEDIAAFSKRFPEQTYMVVLKNLLNTDGLKVDEDKQVTMRVKKVEKNAGKGAAKKINDLITEGFFDQPKTSKEIIKKLKLSGYIVPVTSLPSYLIPKVRGNELERTEVKTENGKIYGYLRKN